MSEKIEITLCSICWISVLLVLISYPVNMFYQLQLNGSCHLLNICNHWSAYTLVSGIIAFILTKIILFIFY